MSDQSMAARIAAKELELRDAREAQIRQGYAHNQKVMSGLLAATHQSYAGGGFFNDALLAVQAEDEAKRATQAVADEETGGS